MSVGPPALGLHGESGGTTLNQTLNRSEVPCNTAAISPRLSVASSPARRDSDQQTSPRVHEIASKHFFLILLINDEEQAEFQQLILQNQEYFDQINYALSNAQVQNHNMPHNDIIINLYGVENDEIEANIAYFETYSKKPLVVWVIQEDEADHQMKKRILNISSSIHIIEVLDAEPNELRAMREAVEWL